MLVKLLLLVKPVKLLKLLLLGQGWDQCVQRWCWQRLVIFVVVHQVRH
jgi:hypothetical protein